MPRSIDRSTELSLQGSLFGAPEPTANAAKNKAATGDLINLNASDDTLSDADLSDDALARPRRRNKDGDATTEPLLDQADGVNEISTETNNSTDEPAWAHHSQLKPEQLTPVLRHYVELKMAHPERVLLYRLGDFFECFFEDAITLSRELELTLTGKDAGKAIGRVPMAGIPHHAAERYCSDLIRLGYSVALCDQLETTPAKGALLKRDITRVLTPGTVLEEGMLSARRNNWIAAVVVEPANRHQPFRWGLAQADVSTGDVQVLQREGSDGLHQHLAQLQASELLWSGDDPAPAWCPDRISLTPLSSTPFSRPEAETVLLEHYNLASLDGFGLPDLPLALQATGGLLRYVRDTQPLEDSARVPLDVPAIVHSGDTLVLDAQTRRNLELTVTQRDGLLQGSLLWAIDHTLTAMGGRCLRRWIEAPLMDLAAIQQRQTVVSSLVDNRLLRQTLRRLLRPMGDLERLAGRAGAGHAGARDLVAIANGLEQLPQLAAQLNRQFKFRPTLLKELFNPQQKLQELAKTVSNTLMESPPLSLSEGGLIHDGVDPLLDGLRNQLDDQDAWLAQQERHERQESGISTLKLQHHRTFGYFLAVSKAKASTVPEHWIRRQTLANEERFITPELKEREGRIFQLRARACQREYELFVQLREQVGAMATSIREAAR
ncbi:MAG: DNA mismatch repair protein MutS, partial [Crocinitomicaceae bacterium]|nr:DNA mismatch repair protein MutS [Crocinitomicaceae bacterium]